MKSAMLTTLLVMLSTQSYAFKQENAPACKDISGLVVLHGKAVVSKFNLGDLKQMDVSGQVISLQNNLPSAKAKAFVATGLTLFANAELDQVVKDCAEGIYVVEIGSGNLLKACNNYDMYTMPRLVSFICINEDLGQSGKK